MAGGDVDLLACYWTIAGPIPDYFGDDTSSRDFRDRVEAAAAAGFRGVGIKDNDIEKVAARYGYPEMAAILKANGIRHLEIEALFDWFADGERRARSDAVRKLLLHAAAELDAHHVKVIGDFTNVDAPLGNMAEEFDRLCRDFAAVSDTKVALEITPLSNVRDIPTALKLVNAASKPNAGVMLDIWHINRGGIAYEDVATIPRDSIAGVEVDDASATQVGSLMEDTLYRRKLCGEGDFDIPGFLEAVARTGYDGPVGVEVIGREQNARPLAEASTLAYTTTMAQFEKMRQTVR